ncbi:MAG: hypothetical protein IT546_06440 [Caulobacteraceae bacterium]|nr:hypothetical protein [Caulobacteraceae bacterium]
MAWLVAPRAAAAEDPEPPGRQRVRVIVQDMAKAGKLRKGEQEAFDRFLAAERGLFEVDRYATFYAEAAQLDDALVRLRVVWAIASFHEDPAVISGVDAVNLVKGSVAAATWKRYLAWYFAKRGPSLDKELRKLGVAWNKPGVAPDKARSQLRAHIERGARSSRR